MVIIVPIILLNEKIQKKGPLKIRAHEKQEAPKVMIMEKEEIDLNAQNSDNETSEEFSKKLPYIFNLLACSGHKTKSKIL